MPGHRFDRLSLCHKPSFEHAGTDQSIVITINDIYQLPRCDVDTARLFQSGRSQAVSLPKEYRFEGQRVAIKRVANGVFLFPIDEPWQLIEEALNLFDSDFEIQTSQPAVELRPEIKP